MQAAWSSFVGSPLVSISGSSAGGPPPSKPPFEVPFAPLAEARALVELYAEKGDRKYERAALKYLRRFMDEANPSLADVAQVAALLAERCLLTRGR